MNKILSLLALAALSLTATAQQSLEALRAHFNEFGSKYPQERVYLHFDNTSYYLGERIWFAAQVVKGSRLQPTDLSQVLYVELLNPLGFPVETQKLKLNEGAANGSFLLRDTMNAGFYEVRAYTAWMLNFTPAYEQGLLTEYERDLRRLYSDRILDYLRGNAGVFSRVFPIYNKVRDGHYEQRSLVSPGHVDDRSDDGSVGLRFFPESGQRLAGLPWRVAFECRNKEGRLVEAQGEMRCDGKPIGRFHTLHGGRGVASLPAEASGKVEFVADGVRTSSTLPAAKQQGYGLSVECEQQEQGAGGGRTFRLNVVRTAKTRGARLGLLVSCRGEESLYREIDLTGSHSTQAVEVSEAALPTGVNIATLFDSEGRVLAQREFFAWGDRSDASAKGARLARKNDLRVAAEEVAPLSSHERVQLRLRLQDRDGHDVHRSERFSLSISDQATRESTYYQTSMLTDLLLSSEVRGFIPQADYYFESDDQAHRDALDHLLMVQGWTRYDQQQMLSGADFQPRFAAEKGLVFHGRVVDDNNTQLMSLWRKPQEQMFVYIDFIGKADLDDENQAAMATIVTPNQKTEMQTLSQEQKPDEEGYFDITMPDFSGKGLLFLMLNRFPADVLGQWRAAQPGHAVGHFARRDTLLEVYNSILTMNAVSPVAKPYSFYETEPLGTTRIGTDLPIGRPTLVMDVYDMMAYSSNITGIVEAFNEMPTGLMLGLKNMGFTGDARCYINGHMSGNRYYLNPHTTGFTQYLPKNMHFYPHKENFRTMQLFADLPNRELSTADQDGTKRLSLLGRNEWMQDLKRRVNGLSDSTFLFSSLGNPKKRIERKVFENDYRLNSNDTLVRKRIQTLRINYETDDLLEDGVAQPRMQYHRTVFYGYAEPDDFYSPDYSVEPLPQEGDHRRTLYWNPAVSTNADGVATVEFYNNTSCRQIHLSAEGMTAEGATLSAE